MEVSLTLSRASDVTGHIGTELPSGKGGPAKAGGRGDPLLTSVKVIRWPYICSDEFYFVRNCHQKKMILGSQLQLQPWS